MNPGLDSASHLGRTSLRALVVIAFLLAGQLSALSHSIDHESERSDCAICRIAKPHKHTTVSLATADAIAPSAPVDAVFARTTLDLKPITCDGQRKRAPPIPS